MAEAWIECERCDGEGMLRHDCGDDTCCCEFPEDEICGECGGNGGYWEEDNA